MNVKEIISSGILELYCMGLTSETETNEVRQWAAQYPEVAEEIKAIETSLENYAQQNAIIPSAPVKEKILSAINTTAPVVDMSKTGSAATKAVVKQVFPFWKNVAAASIILLLASLFFNYTFYNKSQLLSKELASTQTDLLKQKEITGAMKQDMGVMADRNAQPVSLNAMPDVADAAARIYWMKNSGEVYIDPSNLPAPPKGKQYQFWAIVDGVPESGGMINTDIEVNGKKVHIQKMKSFGRAQAFAVSLEDAGTEKPVPSKVIVMGKI